MAKPLKSIYPLFILSLWIVSFVEFFSRGSAAAVWSWLMTNPLELLLNYLFVVFALLILTALTGRTRWAYWIAALIFITIAIASGIKLKIMGVPLLPWDVFLSSEAKDVLQYVNSLFSINLISGAVIFLLGSYLMLYRLPHFNGKFRWKTKIVLALLSVVFFISVYSGKPIPVKQAFNISTIPWDQTANYMTNGLLLTTLLNVDLILISEPEGYSKDKIESLIAEIPRKSEKNPIDPNIIVILNESFWDPTIMKDIKFSEDPIPFYHSLQEKYSGGWMRSPQFGGGTANVEFEVLTGNSMRFVQQGSLPYIQYVNHPVDSLAGILKRQGYTTASINPFHNWFFNSRNVYRNFGFSKFISSEFFNPVYKGPFLADTEVANNIIEQVEASPGPAFVFANTMENHYPYEPWKFGQNTIKVEGANLSEESKGHLETFAQGLTGADEMLKNLVEHFEASGEPTIIVFFGDHLPVLGNDYKTYKESNYLQEDDPDFFRKMYSVPFVVWDNYLPSDKEDLYISTSFLGPYVLNKAQKEGSYYTDFLYSLYEKSPVLPDPDSEQWANELRTYEYLQYDIMFGARHGYTDFEDQIVDPNFILGFGPMQLDQLSPVEGSVQTSEDASVTIQLKGKNFVPGGLVYANGDSLETTYVDRETVTAVIPASLLGKPGKLEIKVKLIDSQSIAIVETNSLPFNVH
ncbi:LTA synthase family protein [Paenibacillus sp. J2TS4]|uniref:LTA synthase family protein n=1 Tax=Paenibacillus sp. J2TS4 TaxID=2807194 RepID=UPI001B20B457|nr:sulfatase-like hydrolase/transferase [Paenibacillus sp. J2TS4]GIP35253.1 sulfatase [Paenibacillus sp. J2TS4]